MPFMVDLYAKYHDKGLGIVGISFDQDHDAWIKGIEELGITWPQISDLKYWQSEAAEMFQVQSIPHMVIVDQQGVILNRGIRGEELEHFIASLL
jgi:alkyl hydroperoxide reductase subunit AhpC